jgi:hypothetical protein
VKKCPGCSYLVPAAWDECRRCGASLVEVAIAAPVAAPAPPAAPAPRPPAPPPFQPPPPDAPPPFRTVFVPVPPLMQGSTSSSSSSSTSPSSSNAWVKVWVKRALFVLVALFVYGAVTNMHRDVNPYSHTNQEAFVAGCDQSGTTETTCRCAFDWIKQNVPVADYKAYAHLVSSPGYTASQTPAWVFQAIRSCLPAANGGVGT